MGTLSRVDVVLGKLTLREKVDLLAAKDWWRTLTIERDNVFVPHIKVGHSTFQDSSLC
jgi:hypothetical protein